MTIQFPVDVFSTYTVTTVSTTTNGNQTTSNRIANFSALPLTFPNTYTCLPGDVFGVGDSPIRFFGDLIVPEGITLRLRPGAVLQFAPGKGVICRGRIQSEATNSPLGRVYLTSMGDDSAPPIGGADNSNGNMWNGIRLENGGTADVRHFRIRRAQVGISGASSISNCHITEGNTGAILRLPATVTGSTILGNSRTFLITEHAPEGQVNSLVVSGNTLGHMSGDSRIYGNDERPFNLTFTNNRVDVVQVAGGIGNLVFTGNTGYSTGSPSGLRLGEYWNIPVNLFGNSTLTKEANQRIEVMSGLSLKPGSTLRLEGGLPLQFDSPGRLIMQGGSLIGGVLTAYNDNRDYGGSAGNGQWQGVEANGRPIANLVIRRAGVGINGTSSISNCHITEGNIGAILRLPASVTGSTILGNNRTLLITEQAPDGQANSLVVSGNTLGHLSGDSRIHGHDERPFNLTFTNNRVDVVQVAGGIGNLVFTGNTGYSTGSPSGLRLGEYWNIPVNLFGNSTLTKEANQRIEVMSGLSLKPGSTLRLEGGLPLQFDSPGRLIMQGGSLIGGVLTAYNDNRDYGGSAGNGQWQGVEANGRPIANLVIRRAGVGINGTSSISNCHITEGNIGAILRLPASVTGSTILGNNRTLLITEQAPDGQANSLVVSGNTLGHLSGDSRIHGHDERPFNLTFTNNRIDVVQVAGGIGNLIFTGNTGSTPGSPSVLRLAWAWSSGIPMNLFGNSTLTKEANQRIEVESSLSLKSGSTLRLEGGLPLQFHGSGRLIMQGGSLIGGVLTAYNDNRDYGGSAGNEQWQGVLSSIAGSFFNVEIRKTAGYAFTSFAGGDQLTSIRFTTPYAVRNLGSAKVDARKSWWNHHNGPSIGSPQSDRGSVVSGSVLYDPWLRSFKGE